MNAADDSSPTISAAHVVQAELALTDDFAAHRPVTDDFLTDLAPDLPFFMIGGPLTHDSIPTVPVAEYMVRHDAKDPAPFRNLEPPLFPRFARSFREKPLDRPLRSGPQAFRPDSRRTPSNVPTAPESRRPCRDRSDSPSANPRSRSPWICIMSDGDPRRGPAPAAARNGRKPLHQGGER